MKKIIPIVIGVMLVVAGLVLVRRRKAAVTPDPITRDPTSAWGEPIPSTPSISESDSDASGNEGEKDKKRGANLKRLIVTLITILKTVLAVINAKERSA